MGITVGFDLDMTLIDPRPGMVSVMNALGEEAGLPLDGEHFASHLGPPLDMVLRDFGAPPERIPELVARFRELYPEIVIPETVALPGAHAALEAVRRAGGRTIVVTGKYGPNADKHIKALGFEVDVLVGELWAAGKAVALREHGAKAYAGDHLGDVRGALAAGVVPIAVTTGPCSREELAAAGAEVIFDSLAEFPAWFSSFGVPEPAR
ncbi:phosphoglycolate phosphatase [Amycolatopsis bartoniae]|uniref:Hydrolase n=1 Tax=Amycolatopsis bartoniae TaxID=941986 RepID=A0A8H9MB81_9PSEU|nr:HAD family hydrolase [Amycolatopsis bartoniae]MBB2934953.1 phosphoglycolate phosphatase [Amycolatopsis bartoniae]TVS99138.1 HAD family hydrolase [Amycolatopsis bartoniae]GHF43569.1 hydrolase [Amycolatopsis bartoniae]